MEQNRSRALSWHLEIVAGPSASPVSLSDVKARGRITTDADDADLLATIAAVSEDVDGRDGWLGRALMTQTLRLVTDGFPGRRLWLPLPPLQSVSSVKYLDLNGDEQTFAAANYRVVTSAEPGYIELEPEKAWPSLGNYRDAVRIEYVAGYSQTSDVPQIIKDWIIVTVADRYDARTPTVMGGSVNRLPFADRMLDSLRVRTRPGG